MTIDPSAAWITDHNFDPLSERFIQNIYQSEKGYLRLKRLQTDIEDNLPYPSNAAFTVLDAGGGFSPIGLWLAQRYPNCQVVVADISQQLLDHGKTQAQADDQDNIHFHHLPIQHISTDLNPIAPGQPFDLILNHAVIEWQTNPLASLDHLLTLLSPNSLFSLAFYNPQGFVLRNVLRGNFNRGLNPAFRQSQHSLTPPNPQSFEVIEHWAKQHALHLKKQTGVRWLYDYLQRPDREKTDINELFRIENTFAHLPPYNRMGRYIHLLYQPLESS